MKDLAVVRCLKQRGRSGIAGVPVPRSRRTGFAAPTAPVKASPSSRSAESSGHETLPYNAAP
jgi:hypothetical protein